MLSLRNKYIYRSNANSIDMRKISLLLLSFQCIVFSVFAQLKVHQLKTENLTNPIGLDVLQPYFSWQLVSDQRNTMQSGYELRVGTEPAALVKGEGICENRQD